MRQAESDSLRPLLTMMITSLVTCAMAALAELPAAGTRGLTASCNITTGVAPNCVTYNLCNLV